MGLYEKRGWGGYDETFSFLGTLLLTGGGFK